MAILNTNAVLTMTSREMAEVTEKRHDNVKRTIRTLAESGVISHPQIEYGEKSANGVSEGVLLVGKRDSFIVVAQLCPEFTARLVDRWQELEAKTAHNIPTSLSAALRLAADQSEQIEAQQAQLAIAAPKVAFVDRYVESTGLRGFREVCKVLGANESRFREFLIDKKIMYRLGSVLMPMAAHMDAGRFVVKTGTSDDGHAFNSAKFTAKGVEWVAGLWAVHGLREAA